MLLFNLVSILSIFPAMMAIDLRRRKGKWVDILCCIKVDQDKVLPTEVANPPRSPSAGPEGVVQGEPPPPYESVIGEGDGPRSEMRCLQRTGLCHMTLHHFVKYQYTPFLQNMAVKVRTAQYRINMANSNCAVTIGSENIDYTIFGQLQIQHLARKGRKKCCYYKEIRNAMCCNRL